jgi:hypothetical protein
MPKKLYERGPAMDNTPEVHGGIKFYPKYTAEAKKTWTKMKRKFKGAGTGGDDENLSMSDPDSRAIQFQEGDG